MTATAALLALSMPGQASPSALDPELAATPAYELLSALDLLEVSPSKGLKVEGPALRPDGSKVLRVTLESRPGPELFSARGLNILQVELANSKILPLESFELLYNSRDRLIAVLPVIPDSKEPRSRSDWEALQPRYFDVSPFYLAVPKADDPARIEKWRAFAVSCRADRALIDTILKERFQSLGEAFPEFLKPAFSYRLHELDAKTGTWDVNDFTPLVFATELPEGMLVSTLEPEEFVRLFAEPAPGKHRLVIPTFPTVYALANMTPDETEYLKAVYKRFDLGPDADILVVGPGTGVDTWIASFRTRRPVHVIGINPLEVANTKATAKIAGFPLTAMVGDNAADELGNPRFTGKRFDAVFWSMPAVWEARPAGPVPPSFTNFWDGDIGGGILERLAKALPKLLKPDGVSLLWNFAPTVVGRNMVAATLETAATDKKVFDVRVERFLKRSQPSQEFFKGHLYTVTRKR
ncbi:MAG: hypothetical protein HY924_01120 [Elusimicrobia bacterium]|nr:hypothetical protein [Elusimicrobiota bacterium]